MRKTRIGRSVLTFALALIMVFELIPTSLLGVFANEVDAQNDQEVILGVTSGISDRDTSTKYTLSLGDNASTENAGRIWTDKTVYNGDATFETHEGGSVTIGINENGVKDETFLVAYSALATSESVTGQTPAPVDVVLILDISGSMSNAQSGMDNGKSRIANTVAAANDAIAEIMALNDYTRVAVVAFSSSAQVLLPLDRYTNEIEIEEEWVQTGNRWEGYWKQTEVKVPIFSLNRETASSNYAELTTNAINSNGDKIERTVDVEGGTNIQMGLYTGMNVLATETSTKANINGQMVQRVPSVILLSDGAPTYSSSSRSWWAPANNYNDGPGSDPYAGNGFKAILVGSYMKAAIDRHYGVTGTNYDTTLYTIGMGIGELDGNERDLAQMTLAPRNHWNSGSTNTMKTTIKGYWNSYTARNNTGTLNINVGTSGGWGSQNKNYALTHPTTGYDVNPTNGYDYVDAYYEADNASAVTTVFKEIVSDIAVSTHQVPTELKGGKPIEQTGYITYTDPIGEYMEVKDVKSIIYAGIEYTDKTATVDGNVTTYIFTGHVDSPVYGQQEINNIVITVTKAADGNETLVIMIPASVIPLRTNDVTLNDDGTVKTHTNNGAYPARVIYSVGVRNDILKADDNGVVYVDKTALAPEYITKNTDADGNIKFYSNVYTGKNVVNGKKAGDTTVEFEPAHSNTFYYITEDMPIYKDAEFRNQVTAAEEIDDNATYYYCDEHYHGAAVEITAVPRTGAQLKQTAIIEKDGYLYRAAGSYRPNKMLEFEGTKVENATGTAEDFYAPTFQHEEGNPDPYAGKIVVYLGNNGITSVPVGGNLEITKEVTAAPGLTAPDKIFEFTLDLDGEEVNQGTYNYVIVGEDGKAVGMGTVSKDSNQISLKDGQTATIYSLPPGTTYSVTETTAEGFTTSSSGETGTIEANETGRAVFTNSYNVTPVQYPSEGNFVGTKVLEGRDWGANDSFTFFFSPYDNAPLPAGYDADEGVTVSEPNVDGKRIASFEFGTIEFTAPGVYRYTIVEKEPENDAYLPGMSYSRALYRLVVTVEDNGNGTLNVVSSDLQRLYDDDATALFTYISNEIVMNQGEEAQDEIKFTNTYSAESVVRVPVALKDYTDNSGTKPLVSGMFEFKLEAVGYIPEGGTLVEDITNVPMPENAVNGVSTALNEGGNITFPSVTFTHDSIPDGDSTVTFRYKMSEVIPQNALHGMTYDNSEYYIDVVVSIDADSHILNVEAIYPNNERIVTFKNEYTPDPAVVSINGNKTLNGRDMKSGETFTFEIVGANAATNNAVREGTVVIPNRSVNVSGGTNGVAKAFSFANIQFKKAGTYRFVVSEAIGNAPAVEYDDTTVIVTVVINDANNDGKLDVASVTYNNGKTSADFVNNYTVKFEDTPVSLTGTKKLTGKTLLAGEFFFNVVEYRNGTKISEGLVSHTVDTTADANGVYTGDITFIDNKTYTEAGTYVYRITEQIPNPKVGGTTYDESEYRYTVVVEDVEKVGKLTVTSTKLEKADETANDVVFTNQYVPTPTTTTLPLVKKVLAGDRSEALKAGEFKFEIKSIDQSSEGGMILPSITEVTNDADGNIVFDKITFIKAGVYTVSITEVVPDDADKAAGITYSVQQITATYTVTDDRNGNLTAVLTGFAGGEVIINEYNATPGEAEIVIEKDLQGRDWQSGDSFDFEVVVLDPATQEAIKDGEIEFPTDEGTDHIVTKTIDTEGETITGTIRINRAGTYKFIVREKVGTIGGIHYDSEPREIVIVATDDSANAQIKININGQDVNSLTLTFENVYDAESTEVSGHEDLFITKNFTGRPENKWLDTDFFEFVLAAADDKTKAAVTAGDIELPDETTLTVTNANKAYPHFGNIIFHKEGEYKFTVTEVKGNIPGVTYDTTPRTITVVVADNNDGELVAEISAPSDKLVFNNTYKSGDAILDGKANLGVIKVLEGREWNEDDKFTFKIAPYNEKTQDAIDAGYIVMPSTDTFVVAATALDEANGKTNYYGDIVFKQSGDYRFVITEVAGDLDRVSYDDHFYHVFVSVTDNDAGSLVATTSYRGSKVFTNTYTPDDAKVTVEGEKVVEGNRGLAADEFEFVISAITAGAPMPENTTVKNGADGKVSFGEIVYTQEGTYEYTITETAGTIPGITYDTESVKVTVKVGYNEYSGEFVTDVKYTKGTEQPSDTFKFVNVYKAEDSEPIVIDVTKNVELTPGNSYTLNGGEFVFEIKAETANAPLPSNTLTTNDNEGNASFGGIVFEKSGIYVYTVSETNNNLGGFEYDGQKYTVTVTVTDDTTDAKLKATVVITNESGAEADIIFNNKYNPTDATASIFGKKQVDGGYRDYAKLDQFSFKLVPVTANAPMPTEDTVKNNAAGQFSFGTITYDRVGEYIYKVIEVDLGEKGYTYDDAEFTVKVTVTDVNGELKAVVDGIGSAVDPEIVFVNTYTPDSDSIIIEGTKELEGKRDLEANDFEFVISAVTPNAPMPSNNKVKNDADGKVSFGKIEYTASGVYEYEITETVPANKIPGVTYDTEKVKVTVNVTFDDATGALVAVASYEKGGNTGNTFEFKNTYKADNTELVVINVEKVVTSSSGKNYKLNGGEFNFVINGTANAPMPTNTTTSNDKYGKASFGGIVFEKEGTYVYTVTEQSGNLGGMTYDDAEYTVTVTVTDNTEKGKLEATVKITDEDGKDAEIVFNNKYNPKEVSATFFGKKELDSEHKQLEADEFKFVLEAITADAPMPTTTTATNAVTGIFRFDAITFTKVGTYEYKITETDLGLKGYTYDSDSFTVKVIVTDEGNGILKAEVEGLGTESVPTVKFENKYAPAPTKVVLGEKGELNKKLNGRDLKANEFEFILLDADDKEVATVKNDKDGKFEFTVEYSKAGTYTYTIIEKNNALGGVTYDEKVYSVTVEVVDKNGALEVKSYGYKLKGSDVTEVVFTNTYKAAPTEVQLEAEKTIKNRELVEGEFVFEIKGEDGKTVKIASNTADGKVVFEKIKLEKAGTFKYTVSEIQGNLDGVIYDTTVYNVVVTVTDDGEGKLEASEPVITNAKNNVAVTKMGFDNTYLPPEVPKTGDRRHLPIWFALMFISGGAAITLGIADKKKKNAKA